MVEAIAMILGAVCVGLVFYVRSLQVSIKRSTSDFERMAAQNTQFTRQVDALTIECEQKQTAVDDLTGQIARMNQQHEGAIMRHAYEKALTLTLANTAYDALLIVNRDKHIIGMNESAEVLFGAQDSPLQKPLVEVSGVPELDNMVDDALRSEEDSFEEQITIHNRNFRVQARFVRKEGHDFIALALQDVTRLVRLNRARRDMVANISHELRHPIANIRITIDALFHEQDKPKRKDTIASLRAIARETDALMWLVQEMSDLAMIESGQAIVRMVNVPITELVDEAIERIEEQSQYKDITVVRHVPEKLNVLCDRDLARRVLINLLHNAVKWSPGGESITVSAVNGTDEVTISVFDNGPGVPDDKVDRIFERFYQVDHSRSRGEGTGLGLAICRHIVEAHGGRIWAEGNRKGSGGRFLFTLLSGEDESASEWFSEENSVEPAPDSNV